MADMTITNQTANQYTFGPYVLPAGVGTGQVTIDTTTNASLYLTEDSFADIVNALYALTYITVTNPPTPFPRPTGVPQILHGDGAPEGVVFATQGSAFMRHDNSGASNALYAKTTGPSLSTGWQAFAGSATPAPATTLPNSPSNGQQAILVDSTSAPTYIWFFQYFSSLSKWLFIGGAPAIVEVTTAESASSTSYTALTTAGPSFTVPRAGDYIVEVGSRAFSSNNAGTGFHSYDIGATGAVDADACKQEAGEFQTSSFPVGGAGARPRKKTGLAASTALVSKYKSAAANSTTWENRWMKVTPVTVT